MNAVLTENDAQAQEHPCMCELCVPNLDLATPPPSTDSSDDDDDDEESEQVPLHVWAARAVAPLLRMVRVND